MEDDTIKLLRECNAGIKMGVSGLDEVLDHAKDSKLKEILQNSRDNHKKLGDKTHEYLVEFHDEGKEPNPIAKAMSWVKTNMKLSDEDSDRVVADLIFDGCNMGVKSLYKYLHKYKASDERVKGLVSDVIKEEERLADSLKKYL